VSELSVNGVRLYYEERGHGSPILVVHGTGGSGVVVLGETLDGLVQLGRVIIYDRRGYGRSERLGAVEEIALARHAEDAAGLIDALELDPGVVVGRGYGGGIALQLAVSRPERVRALALLEPVVFGLSDDADRWLYGLVDEVSCVSEGRGVDAVGEAFIRRVTGGWEEHPEEFRSTWSDSSPATLAEVRGGAAPHPSLGALGSLDQPALVVASAQAPAALGRCVMNSCGSSPTLGSSWSREAT
jgi:pimeloyl-ACP methyl ester carboxylesterase